MVYKTGHEVLVCWASPALFPQTQAFYSPCLSDAHRKTEKAQVWRGLREIVGRARAQPLQFLLSFRVLICKMEPCKPSFRGWGVAWKICLRWCLHSVPSTSRDNSTDCFVAAALWVQRHGAMCTKQHSWREEIRAGER